MADDAHLMAQLKTLMESDSNIDGAVERYIEICFNREHGIREPVGGIELMTQIELRRFMEEDEI